MSNDIIRTLTAEESLKAMQTVSFGRLVVRHADDVDLFPLNYAVHGDKIYLRTAEGTKLFTITLNEDVLFEADNVDLDNHEAWSVVVKGTARILTDHDEILAAEEYGLKPWLPTLKYNFVEITPRQISGRAFQLGEEPERYA